MDAALKQHTYPFLQDGGETGQLVLSHDWSRSSLGHIQQWPQSLRTTLGNILHSAFPMFLFWGSDLVCFYNDAFRPSLGINGKHPAIGKNASAVWPEIWEVIGPLIRQVLTTGKPVWFEDSLLPFHRNGKLEDVYWTFSYSPAYDDDGKIGGVLVTCMETTNAVRARREVEQEVAQRTKEPESAHALLLKANTYLQELINMFKEPLQVLEPIVENGKIVDFYYKLTNAAYSAYANMTPGQLQNKRVGEIFPGYFQTSSFANVAEVFTTGISNTWELHYDVDGLDLYNEMSATKMGNEVVVHFTDFTKLKYLEIELLEKIKELERSNQQLEEFAHAASHDLKEPIRKIQVFTALLKGQLSRQLKDSEVQTFERIERSTSRMSLLVDDLLQYSHVSHKPHEKEAVNLNEVLQQVQEDLELDIMQKGAMITAEQLPTVKGYKRQLQQMFQNLISNAIKYVGAGIAPQLHITVGKLTELGRPYHVIKIKDNGIGFEQQYADKIFQIFTRLHGKGEYSGTGVGLSIVKKVVENHQGIIRVESTPGEGSCFKILLPRE